MKRKSLFTISVITLSLVTVVVTGQFAMAAMAQRSKGTLARLVQYLQLTPEQQKDAQGIITTSRQQAMQVLTPEQRAGVKAGVGKLAQFMQSLNLTTEQKAQLQPIRKAALTKALAIRKDAQLTPQQQQAALRALRLSTWQQIRPFLSPEQQKQILTALLQRKQGGGPQKMQLTDEQRAKMKAIRQAAVAQLRKILTPEQQIKFDKLRDRLLKTGAQ